MQAAAILALVNAAILLVEKLPPAIAALKRDKEMTPEEEAALDASIAEFERKAAERLA